MPRVGSTGVLDLYYVPTIGNKAAPTVAEIAAGTELTGFLRRDGLSTPASGNTIDVSDVSDRYNSTGTGTYGGDPITATFYRDSVSGDDDAWTALPRDTTGYFVISRFGGVTATKRVEVWPIEVIAREMNDIADNEAQRFTVTCAVPTPPNDAAVVAS